MLSFTSILTYSIHYIYTYLIYAEYIHFTHINVIAMKLRPKDKRINFCGVWVYVLALAILSIPSTFDLRTLYMINIVSIIIIISHHRCIHSQQTIIIYSFHSRANDNLHTFYVKLMRIASSPPNALDSTCRLLSFLAPPLPSASSPTQFARDERQNRQKPPTSS